MDVDPFIFFFSPIKGSLKDIIHVSKDLDLSDLDLDPSHDLYSEDNKTVMGKWNLNNPQSLN